MTEPDSVDAVRRNAPADPRHTFTVGRVRWPPPGEAKEYAVHRDFQEWIVRAIEAEQAGAGMTIENLADSSGVAQRVLSMALTCQRDLSVEQLGRIARALRLRPSYLVAEAERRRSGVENRY